MTPALSRQSSTWRAAKAGRTAAHADNIGHVINKRYSHDACTRVPIYNVKGSKRAEFCKEHARDKMVNVQMVVVRSRRCSHDSCTKVSSFTMSRIP